MIAIKVLLILMAIGCALIGSRFPILDLMLEELVSWIIELLPL